MFSPISITFILITFVTAIIILINEKKREDAERDEVIRQAIRKKEIINESEKIIKKYSKNLGRERFANSSTDPYGIRRYDKWERTGIVYFFTKVFLPAHSLSEDLEKDSSLKSEIMTLIEETAIANEFSNSTLQQTATGEEYEVFCEQLLVESGWKVTRTPKTGDHGVDLVAMKDDYRVCIQCKKYSKAVGNSAIQEVTAGVTHYQGNQAAVVTNN